MNLFIWNLNTTISGRELHDLGSWSKTWHKPPRAPGASTPALSLVLFRQLSSLSRNNLTLLTLRYTDNHARISAE